MSISRTAMSLHGRDTEALTNVDIMAEALQFD
jgi:hypothetical protein